MIETSGADVRAEDADACGVASIPAATAGRPGSPGPGRRPLERYCQFVTRDLDEARAQLTRFWERHDMTLRHGSSLELRCHQIQLGRASLKYYETAGPLHVVCGPVQDAIHVLMVQAGRVAGRIDRQNSEATAEVAVVQAPGQYLELDVEPHRSLVLSIDSAFAESVLARRGDRNPGGALAACDFPLTVPAVATLRSFCLWLAGELDRPASALLTSAAARLHCERALLSLLTEMLLSSSGRPRRQQTLSADQLASLEDWLAAHCLEPIGVEDLAAASGASVRVVRESFRRLRGCSAQEALRRHRLDVVRQRLQAETVDTTVTAVAFDCGFFHLGRFAQQYARRFGELPSQTLGSHRLRDR